MTKDKISALGTGILSMTALNGSAEVASEVATAIQTPDLQGILNTVLQLIVSAVTLWKLIKKDKPQAKRK